MKGRINKKPFTLLEIVVTIALVAVVCVTGGWSLKTMLEGARYEGEVTQLKTFIDEIQLQAMVLRSDIELHFKKERHWVVTAVSGEQVVQKQPLTFTHLTLNHPLRDRFTLTFFSTGRVSPPGVIEIKGGATSHWIDFRQPLHVRWSTKPPEPLILPSVIEKPKKEIHEIKKSSI